MSLQHRRRGMWARGRLGAVALACAALAASACGVARTIYDPTRWVYEKKDATPARLDRDMTTCRRESLDLNKFALTASQRVDRERFNRCMKRQGYTVRAEEE
jgi:hypothetical protein